ncbi:hypothetical protein AHAS_Ahas19G0192000 [Arachis hypogaea]
MATRGQGRSPIRRDYEVNPSTDNHAELMVAMTNLANTIHAGIAMATHALRQTRKSVGSENEEGAEDNLFSVSRTLATFLKADPPVFEGSINSAEADNWFKVVEGAL